MHIITDTTTNQQYPKENNKSYIYNKLKLEDEHYSIHSELVVPKFNTGTFSYDPFIYQNY